MDNPASGSRYLVAYLVLAGLGGGLGCSLVYSEGEAERHREAGSSLTDAGATDAGPARSWARVAGGQHTGYANASDDAVVPALVEVGDVALIGSTDPTLVVTPPSCFGPTIGMGPASATDTHISIAYTVATAPCGSPTFHVEGSAGTPYVVSLYRGGHPPGDDAGLASNPSGLGDVATCGPVVSAPGSVAFFFFFDGSGADSLSILDGGFVLGPSTWGDIWGDAIATDDHGVVGLMSLDGGLWIDGGSGSAAHQWECATVGFAP